LSSSSRSADAFASKDNNHGLGELDPECGTHLPLNTAAYVGLQSTNAAHARLSYRAHVPKRRVLESMRKFVSSTTKRSVCLSLHPPKPVLILVQSS